MIRERSPLEKSAEEMAAAYSDAGAFVAREFAAPTERPIVPTVSATLFDEIIQRALPEAGLSLGAINEAAKSFLATRTARFFPPGFSAMVTTSPNPYALLADILACAVNQHLARGDICEFGARLEARAVRWIADFIGYPVASGALTGGGSSANIIALAAARRRALGGNVRRFGMQGAPLVGYASSETHSTTLRAMDVLGVGTENLRRIESDDRYRLPIAELRAAIDEDRAAGRIPFVVVGQGGSAATGAVDPLREIGELCEQERMWFHVDAAYGGPAAAVETARPIFAGLNLAHSVTVDPHKWLYVNYDCGCLLVRDADALDEALGGAAPPYLSADAQTDAPDFMNRGLDVSRGMRALKVWATFSGIGAAALRNSISQDMALAHLFADLVSQRDRFVLAAPASLSIAVFRFIPEPGLARDYLNALNRKIPSALREDGRIYLGSTLLRDVVVLRICIINHRVTDDDLTHWLDIIDEVGSALHRHRNVWWPPAEPAS